LAWKYYKLAAGVSNWLFCCSFFVFLVNLIPEPPSPSEPGKFKLSIGLWGPADSGKTVFLGMFYNDPVRKWEMRFATANTSDYVAAVRDALNNEKWPGKTLLPSLTDRKTGPLTFHFGITGAWYPYLGANYISAAVEDLPGRLFEKPSADEFKKDTDSIFHKLALSDGVLFVVDHRFSNERGKFRTILEANLGRLLHDCDSIGIIKKIPFPVAIAVSKTDTIYPDYLDSKDDPEALFLKLFGEEIHLLIKEKIRTFKIFFFSSIGVKTVAGRKAPRTHREKGTEVPDTNPEPFGLFAPLEWLIAHSRKYALKKKTKKRPGMPVYIYPEADRKRSMEEGLINDKQQEQTDDGI
jgi:hypothetical protein